MTTRTETVGEPAAAAPCPACGAATSARDQFCEACGTALRGPRRWTVEVTMDEEYFSRLAASDVMMPGPRPAPVIVVLADPIATIGRSHRDGRDAPTIDLSGAWFDPGVSHRHGELLVSDAGVEVIDVGSANGICINGSLDPIAPNRPEEVRDGDRVHVGLWTTIIVHRR